MFGELRVVDDVPAAFCAEVADAWRTRESDRFTVALSGGETARRCYEELAQDPHCPVDWMSTEVYWGDERCVALDDPDSNYRLGRDALLTRVGGVHALFPMRCDDGADAYHLLVSTVGSFDVVHLGLGTDGHTASLFPDSDGLDADPGRLVVANRDPHGRNRHDRLTLTFAGIARARKVIVTVSGEAKRDALRAVRDGADLPAGRIRAGSVVWLADAAAAGP